MVNIRANLNDSKETLIENLKGSGSGAPDFDLAKVILEVKGQEAIEEQNKRLVEQTKHLVTATRVLAFSTIALVISTIALVIATFSYN